MSPVLEFLDRPDTNELGDDRTLPQVIEVGQVWQDTLLDVRHLGEEERAFVLGPAGRRPRSVASYAGLAPLALGCGLGAAISSPMVAALGAGASVLGLPGGLLMDEMRRSRAPRSFFVDPDLLPVRRFPLVERIGSTVHVRFDDSFGGYLQRGSVRTPIDELIASDETSRSSLGHRCELQKGDLFVLQIGPHTFYARQVAAARRIVPSVLGGMDLSFGALFALIAFVGLVLGVIVQSIPYDPSHEIVTVPERIAEAVYVPQPPPPPKKEVVGNDPDAGEGAKARGPEGKAGDRRSKLDRAKGHRIARREAQVNKEIAEGAGILRDLRDMDGTAQMYGDGLKMASLSPYTGGVIGSQYGNQYGSGGIGSRGSSWGGGGTGEFIRGGLGTRDRGGRGGTGWGHEDGWYARKSHGTPGNVGTEDPILLGALDKSDIDRVVKQHLSQIRYCYQRELTVSPNLQGKVVIKFVIAKDGTVSHASVGGTSMHNDVVENCLCARFLRMKFPRPEGGGIVFVTYPFVFNRS